MQLIPGFFTLSDLIQHSSASPVPSTYHCSCFYLLFYTPVAHYTNCLSFLHYTMRTKEQKNEKDNVGELTAQLQDWDIEWMNELENGKHWLLYIFIHSAFIIECPHIVAGPLLTCLHYTWRGSQWLLSFEGINMSCRTWSRAERNKEGRGRGEVWLPASASQVQLAFCPPKRNSKLPVICTHTECH